MALTAAQTTQVFKIYGIPQSGSGTLVYRMADNLSVPLMQPFSFTAVVDALNAALAALTASQEAEVVALLTAWSDIGDYDELRVSQDGGTAGRIVDRDVRRQNIRDTLANILGVAMPRGGFSTEARRLAGGGHSLIR